MDKIGTRIKQLRQSKNISLSELAEAAGVAKSYLSNVEREIQSNPSIQVIEKIASSLQVPINDLLFGEQENKELDHEWVELVRDAMASGIGKKEFKEFLEYQKWKRSQQ